MRFIQLSNLRNHMRKRHAITAGLPFSEPGDSNRTKEPNNNMVSPNKPKEIKSTQWRRILRTRKTEKFEEIYKMCRNYLNASTGVTPG